jgi:hypothetical protein
VRAMSPCCMLISYDNAHHKMAANYRGYESMSRHVKQDEEMGTKDDGECPSSIPDEHDEQARTTHARGPFCLDEHRDQKKEQDTFNHQTRNP